MLGIPMVLNLPDGGPDFHGPVLQAIGYPESYRGTKRQQDVLDHHYSALRQTGQPCLHVESKHAGKNSLW